jgi:hypothetical protein
MEPEVEVFDYLSVIMSVITGLAITDLLSGVANLVHARKPVRLYWVSLFWTLFLFVTQVQIWWGLWDLRGTRVWNFGSFLLLLLYPISTFLPARIALPTVGDEETIDLRAYYYDNHRAFFTLFAVIFLVLSALNPVLFGVPWLSWPEGLTVLLFSLLLGAAIIRRPIYHTILPLLITGLALTFILAYALSLS